MKIITRFLRNWFWYFVVIATSVLFYKLAPLSEVDKWLGLGVLAGVLWIVVSKLRERLRF